MISSIANLIHELPHELPNDLRLRILGNKEILGNIILFQIFCIGLSRPRSTQRFFITIFHFNIHFYFHYGLFIISWIQPQFFFAYFLEFLIDNVDEEFEAKKNNTLLSGNAGDENNFFPEMRRQKIFIDLIELFK